MSSKSKLFAYNLLTAVLAFGCLPASAQGYHYSYGNSRVVNQNQTGLYTPSSTYITNGTMSRSAQGLPAGVSSGGMQGLPNTNYGATVTTPGDNQYSPAVQDERRFGRRRPMPMTRMGAYVGNPGDNMRSDLHPYVPGQNSNYSGKNGSYGSTTHLNMPQTTTDTYYQPPSYSVNGSGAYGYN